MSSKSSQKQAASALSLLKPRQEELLSYLQGLAPVGQPFEFRRTEVAADLGFKVDKLLYEALRKLVAMGFVERLGRGRSGIKGRLRVLRRLEQGPLSPAILDFIKRRQMRRRGQS